MVRFVKNHWGKLTLSALLLTIIFLNIKPGYYILGNDNYSPEINPQLSLQRYLENPAWRSYRIFGVPSDSEQADIARSAMFSLLAKIVPLWSISQIYIFFAFFVAGMSSGALAEKFFPWVSKEKREVVFLIAGIIYIANLATSWMFYSPLMVFLAGWAFLPFVLWRLACVFENPKPSPFIWFFVSVLFFTTSAMVPTTFIVEVGIILLLLLVLILQQRHRLSRFQLFKTVSLSCIILFATQLFWIGPFVFYVKTNATALKDSYINRVLTPLLIENEVNANTVWNVPKLYFSWIDINNDDGTPQFGEREFYHSQMAQMASLLPFALMIIGALYVLKKKRWELAAIVGLFLLGWFLIVGVNPPFGWFFTFLQKTIPLFKQVFRWQSSKLFPTLTIPFALLGSLGIIAILYLIDRITKSRTIRLVAAGMVLVAVLASLLWFIKPYFFGNLIGKDSLVKIPSEYFALGQYLSQNDPKSRIYLAPEANTLYFRNYSWGFFGSSFLNYLIPNPIVEFALTTGSYEAQAGQKLMERAYNGEDGTMFARALRLYKTPLVLLDGYAGRLHNGYTYDTDRTEQLIRKNTELTLIWQQGKLELYKLSDDNQSGSNVFISEGHDWLRLNTILSNNQEQPYITSPDIAGTIYPLALAFDQAKADEREITLTTSYKGPANEFSLSVDPNTLGEGFTELSYDSSQKLLSASPSVPSLKVNETVIPVEKDRRYFAVDPPARFLTVGGNVVDLLKDNHTFTVSTPYERFISEAQVWKNIPKVTQFSPGYQKKYAISVHTDAIVAFTLSLASKKAMVVNICLFSVQNKECINKDHALYLSPQPQKVDMVSDTLVQSGDSIELYIAPNDVSDLSALEVSDITASVFTDSKALGKVTQGASIGAKNYRFTLQKGDQMSVSIPRVTGYDTYHFSSSNERIPPVTLTTCPQDGSEFFLRPENIGSMTFHSQNCTDQVKVALERIRSPSRALAMMFMKGTNEGGIPAIVSFRHEKSSYKNFEDRLPYESAGFSLAYFPIPDELISYILEVYSYSPGKSVSANSVSDISFEFIPSAWYEMRLIPFENNRVINIPTDTIGGIDEAFHTNWIGSGMPVRINGWEQGFMRGDQVSEAIFWPNYLAWTGYIIDAAILGGLLLWQVLELLAKRRTSTPFVPNHR